ncbi:unnamed protein product [Adineta steineri]|uniref:Uncharacterized protein n=1 Tax=Adineta steineri TaxID=433720 RepID=A0A819LGD4_9BILA|nr:unnamed protein product [Adineta steineri]CAF3960701.1 unnamed protein product [Adineta steineri]
MVGRLNNDMTYQTTRVIQWLSGEQAIDVPNDFHISKDTIKHEIVSSDKECIELQRLQSFNKQFTTTYERSCLLDRRLNRLSPDTQTLDEAYCTLSSRHSIQNKNINDLIPKESTSDSNSLSSTTQMSLSSPILSISTDDTLDRIKLSNNSIQEGMDLLREIAQQSCHLLPLITNNNNDHSMELYRNITNNGQDFKEIVNEFVHLIENKLSDAETKLFDDNTTRATSPSLFDMLNDLKTCLTLLRRTEIQSLLNVFDNVLKLHCYPSALPENEEIIINNNDNHENDELKKLSQYEIDEIKIVKIEKNHQPLGLTISRTDSGTIHIARIVVGSLAASTQLFQINDRILEINDQPITGHSLDYVCTLMSNATGLIKFLLSPPKISNQISYDIFHVRTLFTYDPFNDPLIPCKELGLKFQRGDILRIVARDENFLKMNYTWWQAYHENSIETEINSCLAGLIPSDSLQQKRTDLLKAISDDTDSISSLTSSPPLSSFNNQKKISTTCFTCVNSKQEQQQQRKPLQIVYNNVSFIRDINDKETPTIRTSTNHFSLKDTRQFDEEQSSKTLKRFSEKNKDTTNDSFRFYEPVFRLNLSTQKITRPIVLIGAPNVGRHELRRRLLQNEPHLFDVAIPHTTRARRLQETPDIDYHFVSEADFLAQVACHSFVEFGQYDRDLYGTSIDDIRQIVEIKRKICILNLNPDALRTFYQTDLYPYIIFIAAPSFERLKRLELDRREHLTDKDYREIIQKSRSIERRYNLLFDQILINNDLDRTYIELHDLILRIQHDNHQWVRACYRRS